MKIKPHVINNILNDSAVVVTFITQFMFEKYIPIKN